MDAALLLIAGNEPCPQPQTSEHLAAVEIMQLKNIIILQASRAPPPLSLFLRRVPAPPLALPPAEQDRPREGGARAGAPRADQSIRRWHGRRRGAHHPHLRAGARARAAGACSARARLVLLLVRSSSTTSTSSAATSSHTCVPLASLATAAGGPTAPSPLTAGAHPCARLHVLAPPHCHPVV